MDISKVTSDQIERAKACETPNELIKLASEEGIELSDKDLERISGGGIWGGGGGSSQKCPFCGSTDTYEDTQSKGVPRPIMVCSDCGMTW